MSLSKQFKVSDKLEQDGAPIRFDADANGKVPCFWIRRVGGRENAYQKVVDRIMEPHRRAQEVGALPKTLHEQLRIEMFAEGAIAGWENVLWSDVRAPANTQAPDSYAPYSKENAIALLNNLPELYGELLAFAVQRSTFLEVNLEQDAKN